MKKFLVICLCSLFILCGCMDKKQESLDIPNSEEIEKEILDNFDKILEVSDLSSSNPYDYTENEYYENIVNLGKPAVFVLIDMYNDGKLTGLNAYLSALAIEDITDCNLLEKYNINWSSADEFYQAWENNNCEFKD